LLLFGGHPALFNAKVGGQAKTQWPELVGKPAQEAVDTIKAQAPGFTVQAIGYDMMATADYRCDRSVTE
jgi:hypothetical protein